MGSSQRRERGGGKRREEAGMKALLAWAWLGEGVCSCQEESDPDFPSGFAVLVLLQCCEYPTPTPVPTY